jgi:DNA (cytosine-5)-methyltransferase 1
MRVLDLFSGIGGFSLGLERAGMRTVAFAEIDPFCRRVLAKHWPGVPIYDDVRAVTADRLRADGIAADVVCGGFPCQDISVAGKGAGLAGERSGLWVELARIIGEVRPRFAIVENVSALTTRGLGTVLGDLAALGYDAEWHCIPASAVGAPHRRDRIWIIAYPDADSRRQSRERQPEHCVIKGASGHKPDGLCPRGRRDGPDVAHSDGARCATGWRPRIDREGSARAVAASSGAPVADTGRARLSAPELAPILGARRWNEGRAAAERGWWRAEPAVGRVADGVPNRVHRLRSLGNAVVPQIPEIIGRAIMSQRGAL